MATSPGIVQRVNVARFTEDFKWNYIALSGVTLGAQPIQVVADKLPVTLTGMVATSFNGSVQQRYAEALLAPFAPGYKYLLSYYAFSNTDAYFYMRSLPTSGSQGHGVRQVRAGVVRRVWTLLAAPTKNSVDQGLLAETALGKGAATALTVFQAGLPGNKTVYIGGLQLEAVAPGTKNGIAIMGDSTVAGSSGKLDLPYDFTNPENAQWSTLLGTSLNCECYNRGVGGETMTSMLARWDKDMTPLAANALYCIIQGGINDVNQKHSLADMQRDMLGMLTKAQRDGWTLRVGGTIRIIPCMPNGYSATNAALEAVRLAYNAWLQQQYGYAIVDPSKVLTNPYTKSGLHPAYWSDETPQVHPNGLGRETTAAYIAANGNFNLLPKPSAYQRQQS